MKITNSFNNYFAGKIERDVIISQQNGIHCRPAGFITKLNRYSPQDVYIQKENREPEKIGSIISLLALELHRGDKVKLIVDDSYPDDKLFDAITKCLSAKDVNECAEIYQDYTTIKKE